MEDRVPPDGTGPLATIGARQLPGSDEQPAVIRAEESRDTELYPDAAARNRMSMGNAG